MKHPTWSCCLQGHGNMLVSSREMLGCELAGSRIRADFRLSPLESMMLVSGE